LYEDYGISVPSLKVKILGILGTDEEVLLKVEDFLFWLDKYDTGIIEAAYLYTAISNFHHYDPVRRSFKE